MKESGTFEYESNDVYETFVGGDTDIFGSRYRLLVFAASVGFSRGEPATDAPESGDEFEDNRQAKEIRWEYIGGDKELSVVAASLTYAHTGRSDAILEPETQVDVLVQYGAAGSRILYDEVLEPSGKPLDNLIDFVKSQRDDDEIQTQKGVLEQLEEEISGL